MVRFVSLTLLTLRVSHYHPSYFSLKSHHQPFPTVVESLRKTFFKSLFYGCLPFALLILSTYNQISLPTRKEYSHTYSCGESMRMMSMREGSRRRKRHYYWCGIRFLQICECECLNLNLNMCLLWFHTLSLSIWQSLSVFCQCCRFWSFF